MMRTYVYETPALDPQWKDPDAVIEPVVMLNEPSVPDDAPRSVPEILRDLEALAFDVPALHGLKPEWQPSIRVDGHYDRDGSPLMTGELLGFRVPAARSGRPRGSGHPGGDLLAVRITTRTLAEAQRVVEECAKALVEGDRP
jgi:hypothetical protein